MQNEQRLIDANALRKNLSSRYMNELYPDWRTLPELTKMRIEMLAKEFRFAIDHAPTIDAVPVVHGRWVMMAGFPACSKCGCSPADWEAKPDNPEGYPPYCHSCGAKMDGGAEQ